MSDSQMQKYGKLVALEPGLWVRDGEWYGTAFRRRMTVLGLGSGELMIHNAFRLEAADLDELRQLGRVTAVLAPNAFHGDESLELMTVFPEAVLFVPGVTREKWRTRCQGRMDEVRLKTFEGDWPSSWKSEVEVKSLSGMRLLHESVFFHRRSRTLIVTDLVFNMNSVSFKNGVERRLMSWNRIGHGLAPSRLCDWVFTRDLSERNKGVREILQWDFQRVIMNHGEIVHKNGRELMRAGFNLNL